MTMLDQVNATPVAQRRVPWNKGKLTGAKPPLPPKHVWSIRTKLQIEGRVRDLARIGVDRQRRAGPELVWDAFVATHQSYPDLSADGKSKGRPALARAYQDRKHGQISGHRSG